MADFSARIHPVLEEICSVASQITVTFTPKFLSPDTILLYVSRQMKSALHILLSFCVLAGLANGMAHKGLHDSHDECAAQHSHDAGGTHGDHDGDAGGSGEEDAPHHHDCCHFPSADFALGGVSSMITFQPILVEIPTDVSLIPEEPVFALDKPPLI